MVTFPSVVVESEPALIATDDLSARMRPSHLRPDGGVMMVDVGSKPPTERSAHARAEITMRPETGRALRDATLAKGDALTTAQIAGIFAAKQTAALIPLCHPLPLSSVDVTFAWLADDVLQIDAIARTIAQTGVEMEAMTAVSIAALTIYDMTKSLEKGMTIRSVRLIEKQGGKSGAWRAPETV